MEKVLDFLKQNYLMTLATSQNDKPRASTVDYYIVDNSIIFATSSESVKANNLKMNKRLSMSVYNMPKFVTIDGSTTKPTQEEIAGYTTQLLQRHPEFKDLMEKGIMKFAYYKVVIDTVYFNDYSKGMQPTEIIKG